MSIVDDSPNTDVDDVYCCSYCICAMCQRKNRVDSQSLGYAHIHRYFRNRVNCNQLTRVEMIT